MLLINLILNLTRNIAVYCKSQYKQALVQSKNKSCKFYTGVIATNSTFGMYNVIFNDCIIQASSIDSHTYIQKGTSIFNCSIGKFCSIATQVSIGPGLHITNGVSTHPSFYLQNTPLLKKYSKIDQFNSSKRVIIGHDVWIGEKAIVLDGITIGTGAIIGAGAVVTKDVEPYAIVGGCPARLIKYRFEKEIREALLLSEWWNKEDDWFIANYDKFTNPIELLYIIGNDKNLY